MVLVMQLELMQPMNVKKSDMHIGSISSTFFKREDR